MGRNTLAAGNNRNMVMKLESASNFDPQSWNRLIDALPAPHLLQTWEWAQVKASYGWQSTPFIWRGQPAEGSESSGGSVVAAVMALRRAIPIGGFAKKLCILYAPKGPLLDWSSAPLRERVLDDLQSLARRSGAIFLKIDPDAWQGSGVPGSQDHAPDPDGQAVRSDLERRGWRFSQDQVQFRNTAMVGLEASEEEILGRMKQKTRYNIRLAGKKGVTVRVGSSADFTLLYRMYAETSLRDGFVIRDEGYYRTVWQTFMQPASNSQPSAEPLIAEVEGQPVAAIIVFYFSGRAYYLYGMSRQAHREKMPNHLLQWEAIRRAKSRGCRFYDLWGAPDEFVESDPLWGPYRFKEGLGCRPYIGLGAWDYTPNPGLYKLYTQALPKVLDVLRWRGRARVREETQNHTTYGTP